METYNRAYSGKPNRNSQPATSADIITSERCLKSQSFMGQFSEDQIVDSIRRTREQHKEIIFKPRNFGR